MAPNPEYLAARARADELAAKAVDDLSAREIDELRGLNDRLEEFAKLQPHPGHPAPRGSRTRRSDGASFGRLDGLGASFVQKMGAAIDGTSGGASLPDTFYDPRINLLPQRSLFVRSLIPTTTVPSGDRVTYIRQTVLTNNAAPVAADATKPTSVITAEKVEAPIRVIAHVSEAIDTSILKDFEQLAAFIDGQLRLGVLLAEEQQILNGDGVGVNLTGILNAPGLQTQAKGADPTPDAVLKAITRVRAQFAEPTAAVFHPNDWQDVSMLRTADGQYIWGSPSDATRPSIWGLPVVVSPLIAEGTALVGDFANAAEVYEREGARVEFASAGLSDAAGTDLFLRNELRFRGESRIGLAVIRPASFCTVTGI